MWLGTNTITVNSSYWIAGSLSGRSGMWRGRDGITCILGTICRNGQPRNTSSGVTIRRTSGGDYQSWECSISIIGCIQWDQIDHLLSNSSIHNFITILVIIKTELCWFYSGRSMCSDQRRTLSFTIVPDSIPQPLCFPSALSPSFRICSINI